MKDVNAGMTKKAPKPIDSSYGPKGGSVDKDTTRSTVAKSQATLGPRTA